MRCIDALIMKSQDNVATVIRDIEVGDTVLATLGNETFTIQAKEKIPFGFKIALRSIQKGELIIKYGEVIGKANIIINAGTLVHVHNLDGIRGRGDVEKRRIIS
jgi:altronate dehydratase small subunit